MPPTLEEVGLIAASITPRYRLLVVLAAWSGLRWGELAALTRLHIDPLHGVIHVEQAMVQLSGNRRVIGPPKSRAGRRSVAIPPRRSCRRCDTAWIQRLQPASAASRQVSHLHDLRFWDTNLDKTDAPCGTSTFQCGSTFVATAKVAF